LTRVTSSASSGVGTSARRRSGKSPTSDSATACGSRIRCQAATGSWTRSRQWETHRTWFKSAWAAVRPSAKVIGVWPSNDAWLRAAYKAHFLMLPKTMVAALRDNSNVRVSEDFPVDYPRAAAETITESSPRAAWMQIPDASETITEAGADLTRDNMSPLARYTALATIFHEMTHA